MHSRLLRGRALAAGLAAALLLASLAAAPATAITNGALDGSDHPYVGLMTAHAAGGQYLWRCSGTLIEPYVFVTAGHCVEPDDSQGYGPPAYAVIFFSDSLITPDPAFTLTTRSCTGIAGYPCAGANETAVTGTLHLHPQYDPNAFYTHDLGVVVLNTPYYPGSFGALPTLGQLDSLKSNANTLFTSVGFGLQKAFPDASSWKDVSTRIRMVAYPHLISINTPYVGDFAFILSSNASTGGTCFGDSGGPNFVGSSNVIGGVTSFGKNPTCGGQGGVYRIDQADDLNFINLYLN